MEQEPNYTIAIFSQTLCEPCIKLKEDVRNMSEKIQRKIEFFPMKTITGDRTAWCDSLEVAITPTLVVVEDNDCDKPIEFIVGRKAILNELPDILKLYSDIDHEHIDSSFINVKESEHR
tara:strand:+ start:2193 stop:2549 length:357 start_codon:yes stop_codon:yes gene_type:complete